MSEPIDIFISYAHEDQSYLAKLNTCLKPLEREGLIRPWHDADISLGTDWQKTIETHLNTAQVILLLISADFMASDYCYSNEMKRAMERYDRGEARVIPIILRTTTDWQRASFGKLQAVPRGTGNNVKPIKDWGDKDKAFDSVVKGLREAIGQLTTSSSVKPTEPPPRKVRHLTALIVASVLVLLLLLVTVVIARGSGGPAIKNSPITQTAASASITPSFPTASPSGSQLKSSYHGIATCKSGCSTNDSFEIVIDTQDRHGNITARWIFTPGNTYSCTGTLQAKHITLTCNGQVNSQVYVVTIEGSISDGHLGGTFSATSATNSGVVERSWTAS